jgi:nicotinamidase-related amidase
MGDDSGRADRTPEEILDDYRRHGLAGEVGFGTSPAVLVVDFIRGFTEASSPLAADFDAELEATARLLAAARQAQIPIFFTTTAYHPDCKDAGLFVRKVPSLKVLQLGSDWVQVDARLRRRTSEILIEKKYASAFFGTALVSHLMTLGVDTLIIAGCTTSGCIRASTVDALQHGLRAIVPVECVGDRAVETHRVNLMDIHGKYGDVVSLEETLAYLRGIRPEA